MDLIPIYLTVVFHAGYLSVLRQVLRLLLWEDIQKILDLFPKYFESLQNDPTNEMQVCFIRCILAMKELIILLLVERQYERNI